MDSAAERMYELFLGNGSGHGTYQSEEKRPGSAKSVIKKTARTLREGPSPGLWQRHLEGERPLGIVPIQSSGLCNWGVIDVDKYDLDLAAIVRELDRLRVPMVVCRSKSGGAHLFLFLREPVQAADLIGKLREIAAVMGYGDCEIFPKQTEILEDRGDLGNWLNMPYFDAEKTNRYGVTPDGRGMSLGKFLEFAESRRLSEDQFWKIVPGTDTEDDALKNGPPCLQYLCGIGISEGMKNNTMFALGVLAKKVRPDGWEQIMERWNQQYVREPKLTSEEMTGLFRSLRKKEYAYRCKDAPLNAHCDSSVCRGRKFGVSTLAMPDVSSITVLDTDPPLFFVRMTSGGTVECEADDLVSSRSFQRRALEQLRVMLPLYKQEAWQTRIQECLEQAQVIEAPKEVSSTGALEELLEQFCTDRHCARERDEILLGKPWFDDETRRYYFRLSDFMGHLERAKFREFTRGRLTVRIRELGGAHHFFNEKGKGFNVWWIPESAFSVQTEPNSVPRAEEQPI